MFFSLMVCLNYQKFAEIILVLILDRQQDYVL